MTSANTEETLLYGMPVRACRCDNKDPELRNFDKMWGDGEVWCKNCEGFIRCFDSG